MGAALPPPNSTEGGRAAAGGGAVKALGPLLSPSSHHVQVEAAEAGGEDGGMNICNKIPAVSFSSLWL